MKRTLPKYYIRHANCVIQRGYSRSAIFDLQRGLYWFITNEWEQLLNRSNELKTVDIFQELKDLEETDIHSFLHFLEAEEILMPSPESLESRFSSLPETRETVSDIEVLSIEYSRKTCQWVSAHIQPLFVQHLLMHLEKPTEEIQTFLRSLSHSRLHTITLVIQSKNITEESLKDLIGFDPRIRVVYISDESSIASDQIQHCMIRRFGRSLPLRTQQFAIHTDHYIDSKKYHTYFNKRIHISANGTIHHDKGSKKSFGNILKEPLLHALEKSTFKALWKAKKTTIDICRDCEFAPICIDRRTLKQRANKTWYSEEECTYNPYICKEEGEPDYLNLKESGITSNARGFRIEIDTFLDVKERVWR